MKRVALALSAVFACGSEATSCPLIEYSDGFDVVLTNERWVSEQYRVTASYAGQTSVCEIRVPLYQGDAGLEARENFPCTGGGHVFVGRAISLSFPGTPARVQLTIDSSRGRVLERELTLDYRTEYPHGRACGGPTSAVVRVPLPD